MVRPPTSSTGAQDPRHGMAIRSSRASRRKTAGSPTDRRHTTHTSCPSRARPGTGLSPPGPSTRATGDNLDRLGRFSLEVPPPNSAVVRPIRDVNNPSPSQLDDEERDDGCEPDVVELKEVAGPGIGAVVRDERCPVLPSRTGSGRRHVLLVRSLAGADSELEQLAANAAYLRASIGSDRDGGAA